MVPPALVPWLFPLLVLVAIVVALVLPAAVAAVVVGALILVAVGTMVFRRYQWVNSQDDFERPGNEELLRGFNAALRRRNSPNLIPIVHQIHRGAEPLVSMRRAREVLHCWAKRDITRRF